jgi:hypothetical protein
MGTDRVPTPSFILNFRKVIAHEQLRLTGAIFAVYISTYMRPPNFEVLSDLSVSIFQQVACFQ